MKEILYNHIAKIKEAKYNDKLIVFVGSGISINSGYPAWSDIIKEMSKSIGIDDSNKDVFENNVNQNMLKIPQILYLQDKQTYNDIIKENFPDKNPNILHEKIFQLNPKHIITTNYDKLIESTISPNSNFYETITCDRELLKATKKHYIIKMHGTIDDLDSIVLKEEDFFQYSERHVAIETLIKSLLLDHTFLFLGYSLQDINLKLILGWISHLKTQLKSKFENKYYILTSKMDSSLNVDLTKYFENNGITILDELDILKDCSDGSYLSLQEKAKEVYSLCEYINESDECLYDFIKYSLKQIDKEDFISKEFIISFLKIKNYEFIGNNLIIYDEKSYERLCSILDLDIGDRVKDLMFRAGIMYIHPRFLKDIKHKAIDTITSHVFSAPNMRTSLFQDFINTDFINLNKKLKLHNNEFYNFFYSTLFSDFYTVGKKFFELEYNKDWKIQDSLSYYINYNFSKQLTASVAGRLNFDNIFSALDEHHQRFFSYFNRVNNVFAGSTEEMKKLLEDLEDNYIHSQSSTVYNVGGSLNPLLKIQSKAYEIYTICFENNIILNQFNNIKNLMKPYICAMLCANTRKLEELNNKIDAMNVMLACKFEKYDLNMMDISIICNFADTKELNDLFKKYYVEDINIPYDAIIAFINLWKSMKTNTIPINDKTLNIFFNYLSIFTYTNLDNEDVNTINKIIKEAFISQNFGKLLFLDIRNVSSKTSFYNYLVKHQNLMTSKFKSDIGFEILKLLENKQSLNEYYFGNISKFFKILKLNKRSQSLLQELYDKSELMEKKFLGIELYEFMNLEYKNKVKELINKNSKDLSTRYIIKTISKDILNLNQKQINYFVEQAKIAINKHDPNMIISPDPKKSWIELMMILRIWKKLPNLNDFSEYSIDDEKFNFLKDPDNFTNYSNIDLRDYMWANIFRNQDYIKYFILHKKELLINFKKHLETNCVGDDEKKLVYKYLLNDIEIWDNQY